MQTKKSTISKNNALNYRYIDNEKLIENKKIKKIKLWLTMIGLILLLFVDFKVLYI